MSIFLFVEISDCNIENLDLTSPTHMVKGPQGDILYILFGSLRLIAVCIIQSINSSMYYTVN